jgi:hypothetical protein
MARHKKTPFNFKISQCRRGGFAVQALLMALSLPWAGISLFAHRADQAIRQRHAVAVIRAGGGTVLYDFETKVAKVHPTPRPPGPAWLRNFLGIDYLARVEYVIWAVPDDKSLSVIGDLPALKSLGLWGKNPKSDRVLSVACRLKRLRSLGLHKFSINDAGWKPLGKMSSLVMLSLYGTKLTDAAVIEIKRLPRLTYLEVGSPDVTDAKLREIAELKNLQYVCLVDCLEVTDAGLNGLRGLPNLKNVTIWGKTKITDPGLDRFQRLAPQVKKLSIDRSVDVSKPPPD